MTLISNLTHLIQNLRYFEKAVGEKDLRQADYVRRGRCFVAYNAQNGVAFAPSRFIGYVSNNFDTHSRRKSKDGKKTNPVISTVFGSKPQISGELDDLYKAHCLSLGVSADDIARSTKRRKFWDMRVG